MTQEDRFTFRLIAAALVAIFVLTFIGRALAAKEFVQDQVVSVEYVCTVHGMLPVFHKAKTDVSAIRPMLEAAVAAGTCMGGPGADIKVRLRSRVEAFLAGGEIPAGIYVVLLANPENPTLGAFFSIIPDSALGEDV